MGQVSQTEDIQDRAEGETAGPKFGVGSYPPRTAAVDLAVKASWEMHKAEKAAVRPLQLSQENEQLRRDLAALSLERARQDDLLNLVRRANLVLKQEIRRAMKESAFRPGAAVLSILRKPRRR